MINFENMRQRSLRIEKEQQKKEGIISIISILKSEIQNKYGVEKEIAKIREFMSNLPPARKKTQLMGDIPYKI